MPAWSACHAALTSRFAWDNQPRFENTRGKCNFIKQANAQKQASATRLREVI